MFEEIIRAIEPLGQPQQLRIEVPLDVNGFWDRQCPNAECRGLFKVLFSDWREKVRDEEVFCPFCRRAAPATEWNTPEQDEHLRSAALAEMTRLLQGALQSGVDRSKAMQVDAGPFKLSMSLSFTPGRIPPVLTAAATGPLRQEFTCEACECRYASVGASFFCSACGHNSALSSFDNTLDTVEKTVAALPDMEIHLREATGRDTARDAMRQIREDQYPRLVGAFERLNEALFDRLPAAAGIQKKGNVFQRIDDASDLWRQASGKGYGEVLDPPELARLKLHFQRRHVLAHRQGLIDQAYVDKSGDTHYAPGQRLVIGDTDLLDLVALLRKLSSGLKGIATP